MTTTPTEETTGFDNGTIQLTKQELAILSMTAKGLLGKEMAEVLGVKLVVVNNHKRSLYRKLDVHTAAEAVFEGFQLGIFKVILEESK